MIPFTNPEIQLDLIRRQSQELVREAEAYRLARSVRPGRSPRWPRLKRRSAP
ncbi:hypothetical protein [Actinoplanes sp. DH11]|uniref:hypothetical protein n=1 Tax=Actinoplanes sp. DH11 TaxID=2857011 RepID=UPI001E4EF8EC|nr:hypothetical protein [Actinoplanes sp. DH11]